MADDEKTNPPNAEFAEAALRALGLGQVAVWDWNLTTGAFNSRGPWQQLLGPLPADDDDERVAWFLRVVHPDDRERLTAIAAEAPTRSSLDITFRVRGDDGETRWLTARGGVARKSDSADAYLSGVMIDVTDQVMERSELHDALEHSEQVLRSVLDNAPATIQTIDREGNVLISNRPVVGQNIFKWAPATMGERLRKTLDRVFERRETAVLDGEVEGLGHFSGRYAPIIEHDEVVAAAVVVSDVTEQHQQRLEIRDSESRFRAMADSAPIAIWRAGRDMGCTYVNDEFQRFAGRTLENMLGPRWAELIHPGDRDASLLTWSDAFAERAPFSFEAHFRRADGEYRLMHAAGRPLHAIEKQFDGYIGTCIDLTEVRRAEEAAELHRGELANALRLATMDQMAAGLAHELHQPLAAISAATGAALRQLAASRPGDSRVNEMVEEARQQALRAGTLLGHMRDFIRKAPNEMESLSVNDLLRTVVNLVRREADRRRIVLDVDLDGGLPVTVGNRIELQQVFINLAQNAFHAMRDVDESRRRLRIETRIHSRDAIEVIVNDHGHGFSPEVAEEMFNVFFTTRSDGLGMGLAISRSIVDAHGGRLTAESSDDGARLSVVLPVRRPGGVGT